MTAEWCIEALEEAIVRYVKSGDCQTFSLCQTIILSC